MKVRSEPAPYCSACFGQYPDRKYVDFEAAWDGPVIDHANGLKQPIDDLMICDNCLRAAAKKLGMDYAKDLREENLELGVLVEKKDREIESKSKVISDLNHTVEHLLKNPTKSPGGRPALLVEGDKREKALNGTIG